MANYKPPGSEFVDDGPQPSKHAGMSKAAKKNAKRKEKKLGACGSGPEAAEEAADAAADAVAEMRLTSEAAPAPADPPAPAATTALLPEQKQVRNLMKKVRQCEALVRRCDAGEKLTGEEEEKLGKLAGWQAEIAALEQAIARSAGS